MAVGEVEGHCKSYYFILWSGKTQGILKLIFCVNHVLAWAPDIHLLSISVSAYSPRARR